MSLSLLCSRLTYFHEDGPAPPALQSLASQEPWRKKKSGLSDPMPSQDPCDSLSLLHFNSPVLFYRENQRPSFAASGLVSFGKTKEEASADGWTCSGEDPGSLPPKESARAGVDSELLRILSKAVEDLGLEWSTPEEPACSHLDEWFLPGLRQRTSYQKPSPFFP